MSQDRTYYLGANGLEYPEKNDAILYGGGLKGSRVVTADKYNYLPEVAYAPVEEPVVPQAPSVQAPAVPEVSPAQTSIPEAPIDSGNLDTVGDDQLREFLKAQKVAGAHLMGRAKMLEKTRAIFAAAQLNG